MPSHLQFPKPSLWDCDPECTASHATVPGTASFLWWKKKVFLYITQKSQTKLYELCSLVSSLPLRVAVKTLSPTQMPTTSLCPLFSLVINYFPDKDSLYKSRKDKTHNSCTLRPQLLMADITGTRRCKSQTLYIGNMTCLWVYGIMDMGVCVAVFHCVVNHIHTVIAVL